MSISRPIAHAMGTRLRECDVGIASPVQAATSHSRRRMPIARVRRHERPQ